jgi:hypothetical protein
MKYVAEILNLGESARTAEDTLEQKEQKGL